MEGIVFTRAASYEKESPRHGNGSEELLLLIHFCPPHSTFSPVRLKTCESQDNRSTTEIIDRAYHGLLSENVRTIS